MAVEATVERANPEEVFALLGNGTRVAILRALGETPHEPVAFGALRGRVGEGDSGKFNYHLNQLQDRFVRRVDGGYELTKAGHRFVGALLSGTYTRDVEIEPIEMDATCPLCDAGLVAGYEGALVTIACDGCGDWVNRFSFPPGAIDQFDREELPAAFDRHLLQEFGRVVAGFCTVCSGRIDATLVPLDGADGADLPFGDVKLHYECCRCGDAADASVYLPLLYHATVIAFFHDHGVDLPATPTWELGHLADWDVEVTGRDPPEATVRFEVDGDALEATVGADGSVSAVERVGSG